MAAPVPSRDLLDAGMPRLPVGHSLRVLKPTFAAPCACPVRKALLAFNPLTHRPTTACLCILSPLRAAPSLPGAAASAVAGASDLRSRLDAFLPALKRANEELGRRVAEQGSNAVDIEAVDEEAPYIQMVRERGWETRVSDSSRIQCRAYAARRQPWLVPQDVALTSEAPPSDSDDEDGDEEDDSDDDAAMAVACAAAAAAAAAGPSSRIVELSVAPAEDAAVAGVGGERRARRGIRRGDGTGAVAPSASDAAHVSTERVGAAAGLSAPERVAAVNEGAGTAVSVAAAPRRDERRARDNAVGVPAASLVAPASPAPPSRRAAKKRVLVEEVEQQQAGASGTA